MTRKQELLQIFKNDNAYVKLVDEMVYLENELDKLRGLPKIRIHPTNPARQEATPAAKLYREYLQQYTNIVRILMKVTGVEDIEEDSPLRKWFDERTLDSR